VVTSYPLRVILHNPNMTDNIAKWALELAEFELDFIPCHAVKSQVLADFIVDWTPSTSPPGGSDDSEPEPRAPVFTGPTGLHQQVLPLLQQPIQLFHLPLPLVDLACAQSKVLLLLGDGAGPSLS
jgi:hypothetical protein